MEEALKWGTINSAYCLREVGAVNGILTKNEIDGSRIWESNLNVS